MSDDRPVVRCWLTDDGLISMQFTGHVGPGLHDLPDIEVDHATGERRIVPPEGGRIRYEIVEPGWTRLVVEPVPPDT